MFYESSLTFTISLAEVLLEIDPSSIWIEGVGAGDGRVPMTIVEGDVKALARGQLNIQLLELGCIAAEVNQIKAISAAAVRAHREGQTASKAAKEAASVLEIEVTTDMAAYPDPSPNQLSEWDPTTRFTITSNRLAQARLRA